MRAGKSNARFEIARLQRTANGLICLNERAMDYEGTRGTLEKPGLVPENRGSDLILDKHPFIISETVP